MKKTLCLAALLASSVASAATPVNGWYTNAFGGYTSLPGNISNTIDGVFRNSSLYHWGYNVGGRIGYQSNPIRYEAEYTSLESNLSTFNVDYVEQTDVTGYASASLFMGNIYYDFPEILPAVSPYLGVGLGYAYLHAALNSTGPNSATYFSTTDNAFAYQGTVGLTYNFAEHYAMNFAYRYVATDNTDGFGKAFQAHVFSGGVTYRFDNGNYK